MFMFPLVLLWPVLGTLVFADNTIAPVLAFAPGCTRATHHAKSAAPTQWQNRAGRVPRDVFPLSESNDENNAMFQRFTSPKIDDAGLPLTDVLLAQIVAPTFQIFWLVLNHAPNPSWLQPIGAYFGEAPELAPRGSFLAPTLIHGAGLAVCWLTGALAAKSFEREAFAVTPRGGRGSSDLLDVIGSYDTVLLRLFKAGAFASGMLILFTQMDLLLEFKGFVQYGESDETDFRLLLASVEVINDIFWEALVLVTWRIIHANFMSNPDNRLKRF